MLPLLVAPSLVMHYCNGAILSDYVGGKGINYNGSSSVMASLAMASLAMASLSMTSLAMPSLSSGLFLVNFDDVFLLHLELFRGLVVVDPPAVEEKPERRHRNPDPLRVGLLQLAHLRRHLDPEVDLVGVLADDLQLDVLGLVAHLEPGAELALIGSWFEIWVILDPEIKSDAESSVDKL